MGRLVLEVQTLEREAEYQEAVQRYEADDEGRHFVGQQGQEAGHFTRRALSAPYVLPQVSALEQAVSHAYYGQVHAHQKIRKRQVSHKYTEAWFTTLKTDTSKKKAPEVAQQGWGGKRGQEESVDVRTKESFAGGDLVKRSLAVCRIEPRGEIGRATQLEVVRTDTLQPVETWKQVTRKLGHRTSSQVQHLKCACCLKTLAVHQLNATQWKVQNVQIREKREAVCIESRHLDSRQIQAGVNVAGVNANIGGVTAVETGTAATSRLVLAARTVVDSVTADEHRKAVAVTRTLEVGFRARRGIACVPSSRQRSYVKWGLVFASGR